MNIYEMLNEKKVRMRLGMYIGNLTMNNVKYFLKGIYFSLENNNILTDFDIKFNKYFDAYIKQKIMSKNINDGKLELSQINGFEKLIPLIEPNWKNHINIFYDFLDQFYDDYKERIDFNYLNT